ncbi:MULTISPECIES: 30S ribosomal protein S12 methylthiotransferase RimO [Pelosinus]|uniref:Ribosomal protein uS12 methylthiotransferase RimO n=1 Tax=Pelosinus fermentans B4 TaxID=1149862 RepID=I8RG43_9FIRM|nr:MULTISPECIES: 30S ribosomal protein S12 methylthiotransferase RimO [Pelosinus]EIW18558.1 MiaB-like tRNA modifying enzyme YliG [Pelosinus fermentans B4]EIW24572.1 Ribosomal protein S12 methylthiotransferase rimO [Pelosinus fermentans A11]OAM94370.1 Ribosomal protein S12 methylthiotransferase rimO [Pelosinus fermentans DSM 17108]SDR07374.1 ribosomal protein S12 methylthiotransferase [Pelosinus fermentans]
MLKAGFISLGCAKNLVDTEVMLGLLATNDIKITDNPHEADILIINTCSFIDSAKEESISTILQMADYKKHGNCKCLIVAGCLGQRYQQELLDELPEVDAIIGTGAWHRIIEAINDTLVDHKRVLLVGETNTLYDETMPRINTTPFYSAYVKIAEGCSNCCSYCIIPKVRGSFRSRTMESIIAEVKNLVATGVKEINLIAQDTTSYGRDLYDSPKLTTLLKELVKIDGLMWVRLLYCYPKYFSNELIELIATESKICKYIDLPLQHANDDILKAMLRQDGRKDIETLLTTLRAKIPSITIRTSFIVGFPGETEEHFEDLKHFIMEQKFDRVGVFTYSQEDDTIAANLPHQLSDEIKQERYHSLMTLQCQISEQLNQGLEGTVLDVLIEQVNINESEIVVSGRSYREAPDVDGQVYVEKAMECKPGDVIKTRIVQGFTYDVVAEKL